MSTITTLATRGRRDLLLRNCLETPVLGSAVSVRVHDPSILCNVRVTLRQYLHPTPSLVKGGQQRKIAEPSRCSPQGLNEMK